MNSRHIAPRPVAPWPHIDGLRLLVASIFVVLVVATMLLIWQQMVSSVPEALRVAPAPPLVEQSRDTWAHEALRVAPAPPLVEQSRDTWAHEALVGSPHQGSRK